MIDDTSNSNDSSSDESTDKPVDPIKQIKSEFGRKQDNVMNELNALKVQLGQIADTVIHAAAAKNKPEQDENIDPIVDPKGYKESIKKELRKEMDQSLGMERERNTVLSTLVSQYPELQRNDSELTQTALRIYNSLSASEKASPSGYKVAVMQAAQEVGVLPVNKRKQSQSESDDFTLSNSNTSVRQKPSERAKDEKIDDKTLEFAKLLGRPTSDPKYIDSLKKTITNRRKSWSRFE